MIPNVFHMSENVVTWNTKLYSSAVPNAQVIGNEPQDGLTMEERDELRQLRREIWILREEREIL